MKLFVVTTVSESGDRYQYIIKHPKKPNKNELKMLLIEHSIDKNDFILYEHVSHVLEISEKDALSIPKIPRKLLNKWRESWRI